MANRIKLKGTTEESFDLALTSSGTKAMNGIRFETNNDTVQGPVLSVTSNPDSLPTTGALTLWLARKGGVAQICLGGPGGTIDPQDAYARMYTTLGSTEFRHISSLLGSGGHIVFAAGDASTSGFNGGNAVFAAGNGAGTGNGGNLTIQAGSSTGSGDWGNVDIQAGKWLVTMGGELEINTDPGASGEVLTSQGAGSPPIWAAAGGGSSAPNYEAFVATASQTVFNTTMGTVAASAGKAYLQVFVNGVQQQEGASFRYTVTGANQITFTGGLASGDNVTIFGY